MLGKNWVVKNYKDLSKHYKKCEGNRKMKRTMLRKTIKVEKYTVSHKLESTYRNDDPSKIFSPISKRGHAGHLIQKPTAVPLTNKVTEAKKNDIENLLRKSFGVERRSEDNLQFYQIVLDSQPSPSEDPTDENITLCDCLEEECGVSI